MVSCALSYPLMMTPKQKEQYLQQSKLFNTLLATSKDQAVEYHNSIKASGKVAIPPLNTEMRLFDYKTLDPLMVKVKDTIRILAVANSYPVLISGPTGTGKEILAQALHGDRGGRFVSINCAGLPENLIESELFGHVVGAFTGATRTTDGLFVAAQNGTLFLDEIGELPPAVQAKLLRALQEKRIKKVGAIEEIEVNCRIIAATHRSLEELVKLNKFREDLFWRINTFRVKTTGLADRMEDCDYIATQLEPSLPVVDWSKADLSGNVRSIQAIIARWQILGELDI